MLSLCICELSFPGPTLVVPPWVGCVTMSWMCHHELDVPLTVSVDFSFGRSAGLNSTHTSNKLCKIWKIRLFRWRSDLLPTNPLPSWVSHLYLRICVLRRLAFYILLGFQCFRWESNLPGVSGWSGFGLNLCFDEFLVFILSFTRDICFTVERFSLHLNCFMGFWYIYILCYLFPVLYYVYVSHECCKFCGVRIFHKQ